MITNQNITIILCAIVMVIAIVSIVKGIYNKVTKYAKEDERTLKQIAISLLSNEKFKSVVSQQIEIIKESINKNGTVFGTIKEYTLYISNKFDEFLYNYIILHYPQFSAFVTEDNIKYITDEILHILNIVDDNDIEIESVIINETDNTDSVDEDLEIEDNSVDEVEEDTEDIEYLEEDFISDEDIDLEDAVTPLKDEEGNAVDLEDGDLSIAEPIKSEDEA